jgi:hypothetical protein
MDKEELKPTRKPTVMSLLQKAGFDTDDWKIGKAGNPYAKPAANPKHCYEWVHRDGRKLAFNIWFARIEARDRTLVYPVNPRKLREDYEASKEAATGNRATVAIRSERIEAALLEAFKAKREVFAIISDGQQRSPRDPPTVKSRVTARSLDSVKWRVADYDPKSGRFLLVRGATKATTVVLHPTSPRTLLVLAENEETASGHQWKDVTGERYHFPNNYKNIIRPGVQFIYYRGKRRAGGKAVRPSTSELV